MYAGASLCWFFFDAFYYGNPSFFGTITRTVTASSATDKGMAAIYATYAGLLVAVLAEGPGYFLGVLLISKARFDRRSVQVLGLVVIAATYIGSACLTAGLSGFDECELYGNDDSRRFAQFCASSTCVAPQLRNITSATCKTHWSGSLPIASADDDTWWGECFCTTLSPTFLTLLLIGLVQYTTVNVRMPGRLPQH